MKLNRRILTDIKLSKEDPWERVYPDMAREEQKGRERRVAKSRRARTMSTIESSDGDSDDKLPGGHLSC